MNRKIIILVGLISLIISITTWSMDLFSFVQECIYCRTERTIIGLLGILFLIPHYRLVKSYLSFIFGFFGAHVATDQIFMSLQGGVFGIMLFLAACALFFIIGQVWLLHYFEFLANKQKPPV